MSIGLRDQRVKVYGYSDATSDGRADPRYSGQGTYWARISAPSGREATIAGQATENIDAVFSFSAEATIPPDGFLRGPDDRLYRILTVLPIRGTGAPPEKQVLAVYAEDSEQTVTEDATNLVTLNSTQVTFGGQPLTYEGM